VKTPVNTFQHLKQNCKGVEEFEGTKCQLIINAGIYGALYDFQPLEFCVDTLSSY
jgi:hypothetical protein